MKPVVTLLSVILFCTPFFFIKGNKARIHHSKEINTYQEAESEAYDALNFLSTMNAFPNDDIPKDGYAKAWVKHNELLSITTAMNQRSGWESIGPDNIGGRTISIAIDPADTAVIWLGSAGGGLWKSETGGMGAGAWQYIPTGYPVLGVGAIAINPKNHNEIFIGTGETYAQGVSTNGLIDRTQRGSFGIGILKSLDGGVSWSMSLDWTYQQNRGVWDVVFNPNHPDTIIAATTEGIFRTEDGGINWSEVLGKKMVMDLQMNMTDPNIIFAGVGNEDSEDKGIYKSVDGGITWLLQTGNGLPLTYDQDGRITLAAYPGDYNTVLALIANRYSTAGIYRTSNSGLTWTALGVDEIVSYQGWYAKGLMIKSDDPTKVLAGGVNVFKSTDSGNGFFQTSNIFYDDDYVHSDIHDIICNPLDPKKVYVITDGGMFRSYDFGFTYAECTEGYVTSQHYIGSISATDPAVGLSGLQDNYTIKYDGTNSWIPVIGGDGCYNAIDPTSDYVQYGCYQYLNIYKSDDQGNFFNNIYFANSNPYGGNPAAFLAPLVMSQSDPFTLYAGTTTLLKTSDGNLFEEVQPNPIDNGNYVLSVGVSATSDDTVYFATAPSDDFSMHVFRSFDGGFSKSDISTGLPNRYPRRITVNPSNSKEVYVVFSGFGTGHIFKSTDAGDNWTDISTALPDLPFHCLAVDPLQGKNIYAGCDFTVYASYDGGANWFSFAEALPEAVMVFDLVVSPSDRKLIAFTHGHGVYRTDLMDINISVADVMAATLQLNVSPNPASELATVKWNGNLTAETTVKMLDLKGNIVLEKTIKATSTQQVQLPLSSLANGTYLLVLEGNGFRKAKKLVVMH
ncbi:MAG: T9SS type A sorting domain-containing protein [Chitinophagaceae bacterium]|nr:T9SS type A sorting domain-containing protein [Chitinophagaceae bacterium]